MGMERKLLTQQLQGFSDIPVEGQTVVGLHASIEFAMNRIGIGGFLAKGRRQHGDEIVWVTNSEGTIKQFKDLDSEEKESLKTRVELAVAKIGQATSELLENPNESDRRTGRILKEIVGPPDESYIFRVGDNPVITGWGLRKEGEILPPLFEIQEVITHPGPTGTKSTKTGNGAETGDEEQGSGLYGTGSHGQGNEQNSRSKTHAQDPRKYKDLIIAAIILFILLLLAALFYYLWRTDKLPDPGGILPESVRNVVQVYEDTLHNENEQDPPHTNTDYPNGTTDTASQMENPQTKYRDHSEAGGVYIETQRGNLGKPVIVDDTVFEQTAVNEDGAISKKQINETYDKPIDRSFEGIAGKTLEETKEFSVQPPDDETHWSFRFETNVPKEFLNNPNRYISILNGDDPNSAIGRTAQVRILHHPWQKPFTVTLEAKNKFGAASATIVMGIK